ncbi:MAG: hypothetical protein HWQ35_32500 [Nostoc sp. NMS1]|uniref:hypothetical protein n=1 Tax=unclassified Nostoc TaxID=2593658 RepID=UPI0025E387B1|nr:MULTISPECIES: hypothetical protein [unclassified Nostoc]MBN3911094.1 hypothetical protein [Nostoc sp. NMS1]MBN3990037.1 hypothetical protein [Nostoc sp. NMS2]
MTYHLKVVGSSYGGGCYAYPEDDIYADLGNKSHPNFSLNVTGTGLACGGYSFNVTDNNSGAVIYTSTSPAKNVHLEIIDNDTGKPPTAPRYDCINGQCILKNTYNTPGIYNSLADCQAVCANGGACGSGKQCVDPTTFCPDGKVCIDQGEFASIEALISKIGSEVC